MITLDGTTGITTPDIDSTAGFDGATLTGDVAAARITGALNATGSAPIYACRAWVNFNGTGTVAIRASGNVSSITDNGVGDYTVNFATAMPDANYSAVGSCDTNSSFSVQFVGMFVSAASNATVAPTTSGFRLSTRESGGSARDETYVNAAIYR